MTDEILAGLTALLGVTPDDTKGHVDFIANKLNGGTVTLEGAAAEQSWFMVDGMLMAADEVTDPTGISVLHGFLNIDPGTVTFRAEKDGQPCEWDPLVWPGDEPGTVTVPIEPGQWTRLLEVRCE